MNLFHESFLTFASIPVAYFSLCECSIVHVCLSACKCVEGCVSVDDMFCCCEIEIHLSHLKKKFLFVCLFGVNFVKLCYHTI